MSSEVPAGFGLDLDRVADGLSLLPAPSLAADAVAVGFTTRRGGVSAAPFDTLNLGRGVGDDPAHVAENRRRALAALGRDPAGHVEASQVHGRTVAVVGRADRGAKIRGADALLTADPAVSLAVHTADCVPVLLWDPRRAVVGAIHAGWRGTAAGIGAAVVEAMGRTFGTAPRDLHAALGPAIGPCHYEVDAPVVAACAPWRWAGQVLRAGRQGHWWLDLAAANRKTLIDAGVPAEQIWSSGECTACRADLFFSYRRDGRTGRMAALIGLR